MNRKLFRISLWNSIDIETNLITPSELYQDILSILRRT